MNRWIRTIFVMGCCGILCFGIATAQDSVDSLRSGFEHPPEGARPRVWWHWMNGNITKEGKRVIQSRTLNANDGTPARVWNYDFEVGSDPTDYFPVTVTDARRLHSDVPSRVLVGDAPR